MEKEKKFEIQTEAAEKCYVCKVDEAVIKGRCTTCFYDCPQ